jgi:hypothetical protein
MTPAEYKAAAESFARAASPAVPNLRATLELTVQPGGHEVSLTLMNTSLDDSESRVVDAGIYSAQLGVQLTDDVGNLLAPVPYMLELPVHGYLYDRAQYVVGRNCNGRWDADVGAIRSLIVPTAYQRRYLPDDGLAIKAADLDAEPKSVANALRALLAEMDSYERSEHGWAGYEAKLRADGRAADLAEFLEAKAIFTNERGKLERGILVLEQSSMKDVAKAFRLANRVMRRHWGDDGSWRAFQLVWIVSLHPQSLGENSRRIHCLLLRTMTQRLTCSGFPLAAEKPRHSLACC